MDAGTPDLACRQELGAGARISVVEGAHDVRRLRLAQFGTRIPDHVELRVHDSTAEQRYLVLPLRPSGTDGWDASRLAALVTRNAIIGTALPVPA